jgi:hypothetical protein
MSIADKLKETILSRAVEASAACITILLGWASSEIAPILLPAIEAVATKKLLLSILGLSLLINLALLAIVWLLSKKPPQLQLKYGIYWDKDKNPHCPSCQKPVAAYGEYSMLGKGYYCKPCNKVFPLADASGNNIDPKIAISEL